MPTALELHREGWRSYVESARRRSGRAALPHSDTVKRTELLERVREAVRRFKAQFPVSRVILFGSLAHQGWFVPDSDVDLAVAGLRPVDYWKAWRLLEEAMGDCPVDLVELESAGASLRQAIERYGIDL